MTTSMIVAIGLAMGILAIGLFFAFIFRDDLRKGLNVLLLSIGAALLTYGYSQWITRHESPQIKQTMFIHPVIAGWALVAIGAIGLQCGGGPTGKD